MVRVSDFQITQHANDPLPTSLPEPFMPKLSRRLLHRSFLSEYHLTFTQSSVLDLHRGH